MASDDCEIRPLLKNRTSETEKHYALKKIITDFVITGVVGFPVLVFDYLGVPTQRGFFCDDESIRYPSFPSTVPTSVLFSVGFLLPAFVILTNEVYETLKRKRKTVYDREYILLGRAIPSWVWNVYKQIGLFVFGACVNLIVVDFIKFSVGRLRPNFMAICKPNVTQQCSGFDNQHFYVTDVQCVDADPDDLREIRLSFPSGHASFSAYSMIYLVIYLQYRMCVVGSKLTKPFLQFILLSMTISCSVSRIPNNKHHPSDVLFGFIFGALCAIISAFCVSKIATDDSKDVPKITDLESNYDSIDLEPSSPFEK